jgi:hypothetical protein
MKESIVIFKLHHSHQGTNCNSIHTTSDHDHHQPTKSFPYRRQAFSKMLGGLDN